MIQDFSIFDFMRVCILLSCLLIGVNGCKKDANTNLSLPDSYSNEAVGSSANDLLSDQKFKALKIEVNYMPGQAPDQGAISHFQNLLASTLNKIGGIRIIQRQIASDNKSSYSLKDIKLIEKANRTIYTKGDTLGVYFLVTDADYSDNRVLGIAFRNTSFVLLGKTIQNNSGGIGKASRTKLEATVLEHEFGHLLGLVNLGTSMQTQHQDTPNGKHCTNSNCLMSFSAETTDITGFLLTGSIPEFDSNCKNDLKSNGGK
jgi:hypothetical protein